MILYVYASYGMVRQVRYASGLQRAHSSSAAARLWASNNHDHDMYEALSFPLTVLYDIVLHCTALHDCTARRYEHDDVKLT